MNPQITIGWREWVRLPEWGMTVTAKADTGAKSSAIDCGEITLLEGGRVRFTVRLNRRGRLGNPIELPVAKIKRVRSSDGVAEERIFVATDMILAGMRKRILINLVRRDSMLHRMLIGRGDLAHHFLVDSAHAHLVTPRKRREFIETLR